MSGAAGDGHRAAIEKLVFAYAGLLDSGDFEGVARLFERASYGLEGGVALKGTDALLGAMRAMVIVYEDGTPRTKHLTTNLVVDIEGDGTRADTSAYFTVLQATDGLLLQPILAGRYADRFALDERGWHFTSRRLSIDLRGDVSRHLRESLG